MPQITVSSRTGYGKRIVGSILGVVFGVVMFFGSFVLLYMNEGRVDVSEVAINAVEVAPEIIDGTFVYVTDDVVSDSELGDGLYLNGGDYIAVERVVEMYSWVEETSTTTDKNVGGSETTETTYSYELEWTVDPQDSSGFYDVSYYNPEKSVSDDLFLASDVKVGEYSVVIDGVDLPSLTRLTLSEEMLFGSEDFVLGGNYLFLGEGSLQSPEVGDVRISYNVLDSGTGVTLFGELSGAEIVSYFDDDTEISLYRMFRGDFDSAIEQMHGEYVVMIWALRVLGFVLMWIGLMLILGPISTLLDVLPILGSLGRFVVGVVTFVVAVVLSVLTILISMVLHSLVAVIAVAVLGLVVVFVFLSKKGKK